MIAEIVELIKTDLELRGDGKKDPYRRITQYWTKKGELVFEIDPLEKKEALK